MRVRRGFAWKLTTSYKIMFVLADPSGLQKTIAENFSRYIFRIPSMENPYDNISFKDLDIALGVYIFRLWLVPKTWMSCRIQTVIFWSSNPFSSLPQHSTIPLESLITKQSSSINRKSFTNITKRFTCVHQKAIGPAVWGILFTLFMEVPQ